MCSASRFKTRPRWLAVLSPEGVEWLWKSALIQPLVSTLRRNRAASSVSSPPLMSSVVNTASNSGPWLTITSYAPGASAVRNAPFSV